MMKNNIKEILDYLYKLEFFSPFTPTGEKIYDSEERSFKQKNPSKEQKEYNYIYYIGDFYYENTLTQIRELTKNIYNETPTTAKSCIFGLKVNHLNEYIPGTFSISRFIYAMHKIIKEQKVDLSFQEEEICKIEKEMEAKIITYATMNQDTILEIFNMVVAAFPCIKEDCHFHLQVFKEEERKREDTEQIAEEGPSILSSFYLKDLQKIKENPSLKIQNLLSLNKTKEIEIDKDIDELKKILSPKNYPLGKWPSKFHPSLMQQVSINLFTHGHLPTDIFSVNGPPGSGKTTLIKEIIASIIVDRAIKLCDFEHPDDAFKEEKIKNANSPYFRSFYKMDSSLTKYSILIASNNNNAVENISLELPKAEKVNTKNALTSLFDSNEQEEIYFTSLANSSKSTKENWGLISARLGKKGNIREFLNTIWFGENHKVPFKEFKEEHPISFSSVKNAFLDKLQEVQTYQEFLESVEHDVFLLEEVKEEILQKENQQLEEEITLQNLKKEKETLQKQIETKEHSSQKYVKILKEIKKKMSWVQKIICFFFKRSSPSLKIMELKDKINKEEDIIFQFKLQIIPLEEKIEEQAEKIKLLKQEKERLEQKKTNFEEEIKDFKEKDGITIFDSASYENITSNKTSQEACPWTSQAYDTLREELFACALELHKAFVLNSKCFYNNLYLLVNIFKNSCDAIVKKQIYKDTLSTLFLFVPVLSTSLASVQKFLGDIGEEELGFLIIDEAGQATPASVLGAINRFQKTILLGDPFQIEPVTSTPKELYRILDHENKVDSVFHNDTLSAQILADYQNCYGSKKDNIWIGCPLLIHRRCIEPMFSIANEIAYHKAMICSTIDKSNEANLSMKKSCWIDIKGSELIKGSHFIQEQADKLLELLKNAIEINNNKLPNLYIITPFKAVAEKTKEFLLKELIKLKLNYSQKEIKNWLKDNCGTIHTFQGKETEEVIIILGCDKNSTGAVAWASKKPNILNVAVSRAKYRITIIGDKDLWNVPYFNTAYSLLSQYKSY